jgi:hypothetical protein
MSLRLALAFALALFVPVLEGLVSALDLARGSYTALAALPFLALAGLPRERGCAPARAEALLVGALALPALALGAALDLAQGSAASAVAALAGGAWVLVVAWALAAERATRSAEARRLHAHLWLVLVPGVAALALALEWAPRRAADGGFAAAWLALDPLVWCHRAGRPGALAAPKVLELVLALAAALAVLLVIEGRVRQVEPAP